MNRSQWVGLTFCGALLAAVGCATAPTEPDRTAMTMAAQKLDDAFVDAWNRGDADALADLYWNHPDVVSFPPGEMIARGKDEIRESLRREFSQGPVGRLELLDSHQLVLADAVAGWGLWRITAPGPEGSETVIEGRYTDVKAERDGRWVYLVDHASMPMTPPQPE